MTHDTQCRLDRIREMPLARSSHHSLAEGACVMEAVSYIAGEPWGDHPECVSPIIATFLRNLNDAMDERHRARGADGGCGEERSEGA